MEYNRIVAVTGMPGLYEILSSKNDGALVRSVDDKSTKFISSRIHNLSHLESIEIYTTGENVNLTDVFNAMKSSGATLPDTKDAKAIKSYFEKVYPNMDFERVYNSDMKKMVKWYEALEANGVDFSAKEAEEGEADEEATDEAAAEAKPKKKAAAKASAGAQPDSSANAQPDSSANAQDGPEAQEKPQKKAAPKAAANDAAEGEEKPKKKAAPKKKKDDTAE
ncbi:MAG: hypothetical protein EOO08_01540 [Chitinophagaceae bacterium]|nr:MAG: hypothetical protein EOO08_01540 [Chitinophagaceae bacterium]